MINLLTILTGGMRMKTQNNQIIFAQLGSEGHHELVQGHDNSRKNLSSYLQSNGPHYPQMKDSSASSPLTVAMELDLGLSTRTSTTTLQFDCCCSYC